MAVSGSSDEKARPTTRVTIAHVANRAGVSPTTVSHVLSGKRVVGAATRRTVMDAIRELGYRPSHVARNLRTRQSHMIAVVVPDITNPFYAVLTRGLADAVDAAGYGTYVCNTDGQHDRPHVAELVRLDQRHVARQHEPAARIGPCVCWPSGTSL